MKRALAEGKVSVEAMAEDIGYERKSLSRWMKDIGAPPRPAVLRRWAMKCGVPYDWLIGQDENGPAGGVVAESEWNVSGSTPRRLRLAS